MRDGNAVSDPKRVNHLQLLEGGRGPRLVDEERRRDLELHLGALIFELDANDCFHYFSSSVWRLIGLDAREAMGRRLIDVFFGSPLDRQAMLAVQDMVARKPVLRFVCRPAYDPTRQIEISLKPITGDNGGHEGWRGVVAPCDQPDLTGNQRAAASHRLLGLMSEALLHRAQDLLMAAQGAVEIVSMDLPESEHASIARASIAECLSLQTAFVGFCRSHLLDNSLCLVSPIMAKAATRASIIRGASLSEFVVVQQDDLLVFADEDALCDKLCDWLVRVVPRQTGETEAIFVCPQILTESTEASLPQNSIDCRRLAFTAVNEKRASPSPSEPPLILRTTYAAFSPSHAIGAMSKQGG